MTAITSVALDKKLENGLFEFMNQDRIRHFYAIYDLQHLREKEAAWVALSNSKIVGYLLEHDKRILHIRGNEDCAIPLLRNSELTTPLFNIEPQHISATSQLYEPTEPADKTTTGRITTFEIMKATAESFKPIIQHSVQELTKENVEAFRNLLGAELQRAQDLLRGLAFGSFKGDKLVSSAVSPEMLDDLAIIRGVCTAPEERNKGYATSTCSTLVEKLIQKGKEVILYVSKDNPTAIEVYRKIGFRETGHMFLGFTAKRKSKC